MPAVRKKKLTAKQELFVAAIVDGMNQSDAYRHAYKADDMKQATIANNAYMLFNRSDITATIRARKSLLVEKHLWTREDSIKTLKTVVEEADRVGDKVSAVKELNAMHGFNAPTKTEMTIDFPKIINVIAGRS